MKPCFESPEVGAIERLRYALKFEVSLLEPDGAAGGLECIVAGTYIGPVKKGIIRLSIYTLRCKSAFPSVRRNMLHHNMVLIG